MLRILYRLFPQSSRPIHMPIGLLTPGWPCEVGGLPRSEDNEVGWLSSPLCPSVGMNWVAYPFLYIWCCRISSISLVVSGVRLRHDSFYVWPPVELCSTWNLSNSRITNSVKFQATFLLHGCFSLSLNLVGVVWKHHFPETGSEKLWLEFWDYIFSSSILQPGTPLVPFCRI